MILTGKQVKYRGTVTGLRISAVDGTAFIDAANSSITDLADGNHQKTAIIRLRFTMLPTEC